MRRFRICKFSTDRALTSADALHKVSADHWGVAMYERTWMRRLILLEHGAAGPSSELIRHRFGGQLAALFLITGLLALALCAPASAHHAVERSGTDIQALVGPLVGFGPDGQLRTCYTNVASQTPHLPGNTRLIGYSAAVDCDRSDMTILVRAELRTPTQASVIATAPTFGPHVVDRGHSGAYYYRRSDTAQQRVQLYAEIRMAGAGKWVNLPVGCTGTNTGTATC